MADLGDRRTYLGASEVGAALGYSPYTTRRELWEYKTGRRAAKTQTPQMRRGHDLEPLIAALYEEQTKRKVLRREQEFIHPTLHWLKYHADGVYTDFGGVVGMIEFKAPGTDSLRSWIEGGLPTDYIFQVQTGMLLTAKAELSVAVYDYNQHKVHVFDVKADKAFQLSIINGVRDFWEHVTNDTPPEEAVETIDIPTVDGTLKVLSGPTWEELADILLQARTTRLMAEAEEEKTIGAIKKAMESRGLGLVMLGQTCRISYMPGADRVTIKGKELLAWVQELALRIKTGDEHDVHEVVGRLEDFTPSTFQSTTPTRSFRPTFYGEAKGEIDAARG